MKQSNAKVNVSGVDEGTTVNPFMRGGLARLSLPRAVRVEARESGADLTGVVIRNMSELSVMDLIAKQLDELIGNTDKTSSRTC